MGLTPEKLTPDNIKALRAFYNLSKNKTEYNEMKTVNKLIADTADMVNKLVDSPNECS